MPRHTETPTPPYTPEQLFDLVADVERYQEFLPWVAAVRSVRQTRGTETVADLVVGFRALKETFTSKVTPDARRSRSTMSRARSNISTTPGNSGPTGRAAPSLDFCVDFAFRSRIFAADGADVRRRVQADVGAFEDRAHAVYGRSARSRT